MKKLIFVILLSFILFNAFIIPQTTGVIKGKVIDLITKQPLPGVNVLVMDTNFGAATDADGNYIISNLPSGSYRIRASIIGYEPQIKTDIVVGSASQLNVDFELNATSIELENVTVTSGYFRDNPFDVTSTRSFSNEEIRRSPGGFEDVIRALSVLPGVAQADAGRNDLIVRGGAPSENLYLVDGFEVNNINHFGTQGAAGGPLSYINLDFVKETSFSTGGFPSLYGDKLSSVLRINLREGRDDRFGGKATISATQFGLDLEGPLSEKSTFIISARRSYLDFIFKAADFAFVPEYYDAFAKADFKLDRSNSLSFLFISAFDNVKFFNDDADQRYDNSTVLGSDQIQYVTGVGYTHLYDNGFAKITLGRNYVDYDTRQRDSLLNPIFTNKSIEEENFLRADLVYQFSKSTEINFGGTAKLIEYSADILFPSFVTTFGDTLPTNNLTTEENFYKYSSYLNLNNKWFDRLTTNIGLRADVFTAIENSLELSPRFSTSYQISNLTRLNFSTGIYHQSPSYIWLTAEESNKNLDMIKVNQFILGVEQNITADAQVVIEGFIKDYKNYPTSIIRPYLVLANTGAGFAGSDDNFSAFGLEPLVSKGEGLTKGIELSAQKKLSESPFYGILSLTYSETDFIPLDGIERPGSYDQTWLFNLSGGYQFSSEWEVSLKFRYASGKPYTVFNPDGTQDIEKYNQAKLDPVHSLDLRVDKRWFFTSWTLTTYLDVQNVYNNKNVTAIRWDRREMDIEKNESFGLLPSIGISAEF